jgi:tetraacyldisaccharide 4'-kinase
VSDSNTDQILPEEYNQKSVLVFSGIGNDNALRNYIKQHFSEHYYIKFSDHHKYNQSDIERIKRGINNIKNPDKIIITTEKDVFRLKGTVLENEFRSMKLYYLPIKIKFQAIDKTPFDNKILEYVGKNKKDD